MRKRSPSRRPTDCSFTVGTCARLRPERPEAVRAIDRADGVPVVIYFPGNAGHRGYRAIELDVIARLGADVYLFDYRGYGDNPGSPSEEKFADDARAVWQTVTGKRGEKPARRLFAGRIAGRRRGDASGRRSLCRRALRRAV